MDGVFLADNGKHFISKLFQIVVITKISILGMIGRILIIVKI